MSKGPAALLLALSLVLSACQGATSPSPSVPAVNAPKVPTGKLVVGYTGLAQETFLPWTGSLIRKTYLQPMYDFLIHAKSDTGEFLPSLAKSWETSSDRLTWTFRLREGVKWHGDWGDLTSEDVKFTIEKNSAKESLGFSAPFWRAAVDRIETPDPLSLVLRLKKPSPALLAEFSTYGSLWIVSKKHVSTVGDKEADQKPIGTGPYRFVRLVPGQEVEFEAQEKHWRVVPDFKTFIFRNVSDESARLAALRAGDVDLAPVSPASAGELAKEGFRVQENKKSYGTMFMFGGLVNQKDKRFSDKAWKDPWADQRVRLALNLAVDRKAIVDKVYRGLGQTHSTGWVLPGWEQLEAYPYDPARAKSLLAEAGFANGFEAELPSYTLSPGAEMPLLVEAVGNYWLAIGVKIKIVPVDFANYRAVWQRGQTAGRINVHRMPFFPDWGSLVFGYFGIDGNLTAFADDDVAKLTAAAVAETDVQKRAQLMGDLGRLLRKKDAMVGIAVVSDPYALGKKVGEWPALAGSAPFYWDYVTASQPLKIFRLFEP